MYLARLMWRSASESKPVYSRYSRLSQAGRTAKPIRIISAVSSWFRRRTSHELNSLNSIRLMWSTASELGLRVLLLNPIVVRVLIERLIFAHGVKSKTELLIHLTSEYLRETTEGFCYSIFSFRTRKIPKLTSNGRVMSSSCAVR